MESRQQPKQRGLLGRLCPGEKKLLGKTFYLDNVKKRPTTLLLEAISLLGGRVESFLHKDVTFVVTGSQEALKNEKYVVVKEAAKAMNDGKPNVLSSGKQQPGTPRPMAYGSRGMALLEKAICNNDKFQRSSVLSNARSWGVKIVYVDDVIMYLKHLTRESLSSRHKRTEKASIRKSCATVKATPLRSSYLKIEDVSRKYKPLHMQSMTFPSLCYLGQFSPFESPPPPRFEQQNRQTDKKRDKKIGNGCQEKAKTPLSCTPSPWRPRKKDHSYCECCHQTITNLEEHLESDQHRSFVSDPTNYRSVDDLLAQMVPGFDPDPHEQSKEKSPTPLHFEDVSDLQMFTDAETKCALQALQQEDSCFDELLSYPSPKPPALAAQTDLNNPDIHPQFSHNQPPALSPTMPVLTVESVHLQRDDFQASLLSDPYSFPPVLSPQVPFSSIEDPHSSYSDPPVLSPQKFVTLEQVGVTNGAESRLLFPLPTPLPSFLGSLKEEQNFSHEARSARRSFSLPRLSATTQNPRKRCRSASPEPRNTKKKRLEMFEKRDSCYDCEPKASNTADLFKFDANVSLTASPTLGSVSLKQTETGFSCVNLQLFSSKGRLFDFERTVSSVDTQHSFPLCASVCIDPTLIPDPAAIPSASSDSDWDCDLLTRLEPTATLPRTNPDPNCELDKDLLHRPCPWMQDSNYESQLHTVLQPCSEEVDQTAFSRTVVPIVEVLH